MPRADGQYSTPFPVIQQMDTNGDETGTINANGNYSVTPAIFYIQPPPGVIYFINMLQIMVSDTGSPARIDYGNITGGVTNGPQLRLLANGNLLSFPGKVIPNNGILASVNTDYQQINFAGSDDSIKVQFKYPAPIILNGNTGDQLQTYLTDDYTTLTDHRFIVFGEF